MFSTRPIPSVLLLLSAIGISACSDRSQLDPATTFGSEPTLVEPDATLIPTVNIADAVGWPEGNKPTTALNALQVSPFAKNLDHPRWLYTLPNGDVLVAESNKPQKHDEEGGIKQWITKKVMSKAGAGSPSADRITLLRDADKDGIAETKTTFLSDLHSPFGMVLVGNTLYVANTDAIVSFPYEQGQTEITAGSNEVIKLPAGKLNHHWTKNIVASKDGTKLYASIGSNSNIAENGFDAERGRAAIWEINIASGEHRIFASGLRNPVGMTWVGNTLWTSVNERDELGNDLVPDYMTSVQDGAFYGWPYSYYGQHIDTRVEQRAPELVKKALKPDYALGAHTASLGLFYTDGKHNLHDIGQGMFIGQHGSWNREPRAGYKVLFVPFSDQQPAGKPIEILSGFLSQDGQAQGRPVGVEINKQGDLLVADDVGNIIWRVSSSDSNITHNPN
ncbi:sorbosone dehydrogenase family protein [Paraglaciecola polaris]|uniref:PQQ-dependent sugar dehydrogenase n=1 Tax=Paraglaciecola polaris TaxID=222814 RepID=UPI0030ECE668